MKPINDNIVIESVVGRFLEHSRIFYFGNVGKPKVFISSADLLTRNLDKRVELMTPITKESSKKEILTILGIYLRRSSEKYIMDKMGVYGHDHKAPNVSCQEIFMKRAVDSYKYRNIAKEIKYKKR